MDKKHRDLLDSLINELNSKSDDEFFEELINAGIHFDDSSDNSALNDAIDQN